MPPASAPPKQDDLPSILDIEASGFGRGSYPIEIGLIRSDGRSWCTLIHPHPDWTSWCREAEGIHGVPRAVLFEKGRDIQQVANRLNELLAGQTIYSDAWGQDYAWLALLFETAERRMGFRLEALHGLLSEPQKAIWHDTRRRVESLLGLQRHRASADARILQMTYHWSRQAGASPSPHHALNG